MLFDRLKQHERIPAAVPELILRQVRRDGVDPGRKLLGLVEAVEVPEHADKDLLHEVLRPLAVSNGPIDEVEQPGLVAVHQGAEGLRVARMDRSMFQARCFYVKIRHEPYRSHHLPKPRCGRSFTDSASSRLDTSVLVGGQRFATTRGRTRPYKG